MRWNSDRPQLWIHDGIECIPHIIYPDGSVDFYWLPTETWVTQDGPGFTQGKTILFFVDNGCEFLGFL